MADAKEFQSKIQRIGALVADLDKISDPETRAGARALMQLLLDLHAVGLEQVMEIVAKDPEAGERLIDNLGGDPLVSSLLVLYGLHPLHLEDRIARAVERVRPSVRKAGGKLELLGAEQGMVRLHVQIEGHACGSTGKTLKAMVEDALYEAAPDIETVVIEGLEEPSGANGFVPLGKLGVATVASGVER